MGTCPGCSEVGKGLLGLASAPSVDSLAEAAHILCQHVHMVTRSPLVVGVWGGVHCLQPPGEVAVGGAALASAPCVGLTVGPWPRAHDRPVCCPGPRALLPPQALWAPMDWL